MKIIRRRLKRRMEALVLYQWRWIADHLKPALIVRQFAAEYALLQASGSLLRYRFWRERNFAILDLFLPLRGRARAIRFSAYYIALHRAHFPDAKLLSLSPSLSSPLYRVDWDTTSGIRVRHASLTWRRRPSWRWWAAASCELNANRRRPRRLAPLSRRWEDWTGVFVINADRTYRRRPSTGYCFAYARSESRSRNVRSVNTFASTADVKIRTRNVRSSLEGREEFRVFHGPDNYPCDFGGPPCHRLWERSSSSARSLPNFGNGSRNIARVIMKVCWTVHSLLRQLSSSIRYCENRLCRSTGRRESCARNLWIFDKIMSSWDCSETTYQIRRIQRNSYQWHNISARGRMLSHQTCAWLN